VERGGEHLLGGGFREEIASELFGRELIVGDVLAECLDDTIAIAPDRA
jgi:hypothetical protein